MNNNDERDYAEESANARLLAEGDHCYGSCSSLDEDTEADCVHCECCCGCLGCEYGPRGGMLLNPPATTEGVVA